MQHSMFRFNHRPIKLHTRLHYSSTTWDPLCPLTCIQARDKHPMPLESWWTSFIAIHLHCFQSITNIIFPCSQTFIREFMINLIEKDLIFGFWLWDVSQIYKLLFSSCSTIGVYSTAYPLQSLRERTQSWRFLRTCEW